jgi:galactitol-specific phosphotransferase system IIB component
MGILEYLARIAAQGVWTLMQTSYYGYFLVPIAGAVIGWRRNGKYPTMRRIWVSFVDSLAAAVVIFVLVFIVQFTIACKNFWNPHVDFLPPVPPTPPTITYAAAGKDASGSVVPLKQRAFVLAEQLLDFAYAREGPINSWKQQAVTQALLDTMRNQQTQNAFRARLNAWNAQTDQEFIKLYWPQVQSLVAEASAADVDVSPISRAVASDSPRNVALMLSVVADRIGKKRPYPRTLTPVEARAIMLGLGGVEMQVYGYKADGNSMRVAETLRREFAKEQWNVNKAVLPIETSSAALSGVHIVFPSADLTLNFEGTIEAFKACELETKVDIRWMKQPPTILKIEVWPQKEPAILIGPDLTR